MTHMHSGFAATRVDVQTQGGRDSLPSVSGQSIAGVIIPDTVLVRDATAVIREADDDLLFDQFDDSFVRDDFVDIILNNGWPE